MQAELINHISLFSGLPRAEIEYLASTLHACEFPATRVLLQEGHVDDSFYVLLEGQVEIIKALGTSDERLLAVRDPGILLGEMSLFSPDSTHTASVRALTQVKLLEITRSAFDALLHRQPQLAYEMIRLLSRRLQESENLTILDLKEKNRQLTLAYQELQAVQAQLVEKERLERELEIARQIQRSFLPRSLPQQAQFGYGAQMIPARAVGGDFYDFIPLEGDRLGIVVGDVSDKGVPAALFMALTYSLVRAEAERAGSPGELLQAVNRHLLNIASASMFVTLVYGVLDCLAHRFHYARAGHPLPVILDERGQEAALPSKPGQLLGVFEQPVLDEQCVDLLPGSVVFIYSDGITEAMDADGEAFGLERLKTALAIHRDASAQEVCDLLYQLVKTYSGGSAQQDDFTAVAIRCLA